MSERTRDAVRSQFVDFFVAKGHRAVASSPVFPKDDPTLLFTNAGMNQFKDVFLGTGRRDYTRAVDSQKCIRVSGKHNDLEEVGRDTYHHTFFEMLGNWSFGDYFKEEAIPWAWELLTDVWRIPKERLWVTVFAGDPAAGLSPDTEAETIWRERTDIAPERVLRFDKQANFWEMGETGPCGPCSEIHIDRGGPGTDPRDGANRAIGVNAGNERFMELWNLVFMQFNRLDDGSLKPLPARHVDTGMGFERILAVLQGKRSNYDTDLFAPIFARIAKVTGRHYGGGDEEVDVAFRVVADHVRAVTAAFADGALPSNTGRGYVLRRLIRRAARYGSQSLGMQQPFLFEVAPTVAEVLGAAFPEIRGRIDHVQLLLQKEEEAFGRTLGRGLVQFEKLAKDARAGQVLDGGQVFDLYATYGFPRDLVELMARERGLAVDAPGWEAAEREHQAASKSEGAFKQLLSAESLENLRATRSTYHDPKDAGHEFRTRIVGALRPETPTESFDLALVLEESPFYPEAGGQVGDTGTIESADGSFRMRVVDTRKEGSVVLHKGNALAEPVGGVEQLLNRTDVLARVDAERRSRVRKNHTATHLLHKALRDVLGEHVTQQGSYVGPDRLRFDFSHTQGMTTEEIEEVERRVNERVFANAPVTTTEEDLAGARARGVMALFGEKYDDVVRVVDVGGWSTELCGGTHVRAAGDIGPFAITTEGAIQAGVRRIEAVTGPEAVRFVQAQRRLLMESARAMKVRPEELPERIAGLQQQVKEAKKQKQKGAQADVSAALEELREALREIAGVPAGVVDLPALDQNALRELGTRAKGMTPDLVLVLFGRDGDRVPFVAICQGTALARGVKAGELAQTASSVLGGGGGGRPDMAQGQGLEARRVEDAALAVWRHLETTLVT